MAPLGGGTSASGNDAASPPVTRAREASPPPPFLAALSRLEGDRAAAAAAFDGLLATEVSPVWRALALLGRGLCEELGGARAAARRSVRAALEQWAATDPDACAIAVAALGRALAAEVDSGLGIAFLEAALRLSGGSSPEVLGAVSLELGSAAAENGEAATAVAHWERAMECGDPRTRAAAAADLGRLAAARGDVTTAERMFERALAVVDGPHLRVVADGLVALASQNAAADRWAEAEAALRRALDLRRAERDGHGVAGILHDLGVAEWRRGRTAAATRLLEESRAGAEELGDEGLRCATLGALAGVALDAGRLVVALAYAQEATLAAGSPSDRRLVATVLRRLGDEARRQGSASVSGEAFRAAARILASDGG
jgi:tetratricopeptide (TPR) repeat protein